MTIGLYIKVVFMIFALIGATLLIFLENPIYSIFSLLISIVSTVVVLLLSKVEFLAYTFLIVYVGAIAVLFLFVIMMLNIKLTRNFSINFSSWEFYWMLLLTPKFIFCLKIVIDSYFTLKGQESILSSVNNGLETVRYCEYILNDIEIFSKFLYTQYAFAFILSGIVLLVSMIGALILTTHKTLIK